VELEREEKGLRATVQAAGDPQVRPLSIPMGLI